MKKTALAVLGMFVLSSFSFAGGENFSVAKKMDPEQKAKWAAAKKERTEYVNNLEILIGKYNNASDADKDSVKQEITALVSVQMDKDIAAKKDMIEFKKKEISMMEAKISEMESNKNAFVDKTVDFFLSEKGQEKIQKMKDHQDCAKDYKKICKKDCKKDCKSDRVCKKDCKKDKKACKDKKDCKKDCNQDKKDCKKSKKDCENKKDCKKDKSKKKSK